MSNDKNRSNKIVWLLIAIICVGIFALPATVSLFSGQHVWYGTDITSGGDQAGVPCEKCHTDIAAELATDVTPGDGGDGAQKGHQLLGCEGCHIKGVNATKNEPFSKHVETCVEGSVLCSLSACHGEGYNGNSNKSRGITDGMFHAAATVECVDCHNSINFGTDLHDVEGQITGDRAAHKPFYEAAITAQNMSGANEACVGCHTHVRVNITWTHPQDMKFTATEDKFGTWTVDNFEGTGTTTVTTSG